MFKIQTNRSQEKREMRSSNKNLEENILIIIKV
jgi:hypothetical protein